VTAYVSLLRGVNLGPTSQISMPALKQAYEDHGFESVATYIRSGNVVFSSPEDPDAVRARIEEAIASRFDLQVDVVVRSREEMADVLRRNPFGDADPAHLAVVFLSAEAPAELTDKLAALDLGSDEYAVDGREIYLRLPNGFGRSKLATRMSGLRDPVVGTVRNWRTVSKLADLSAHLDPAP
jgi:uncharacterized protein (DUF1697 family)